MDSEETSARDFPAIITDCLAMVIGVWLGTSCIMRVRHKAGAKWERRNLTLEPGSAYMISGEARTLWEHSIPPVEELRYSVEFRSMRG